MVTLRRARFAPAVLIAVATLIVGALAQPAAGSGSTPTALRAIWHFDVVDVPLVGQTPDDSGNGNDGTLVGGASIVDEGGRFESGLSVGGGVVTVADATSLQLTGSFTYEAWLRPATNPASGDFAVIMAKWKATDTGNAGIFFALRGDKLFGRLSTDGSNFFDVNGATTVSTKTWHHVALALDTAATQARLYLDGGLDGTTTDAALTTVNGKNGIDVTIGAYNPFGTFMNHLDGRMDEARIWSRALSDAEIAQSADMGLQAQAIDGQTPTAGAIPKVIDQAPEGFAADVFTRRWDLRKVPPATNPVRVNLWTVTADPAVTMDTVQVTRLENGSVTSAADSSGKGRQLRVTRLNPDLRTRIQFMVTMSDGARFRVEVRIRPD